MFNSICVTSLGCGLHLMPQAPKDYYVILPLSPFKTMLSTTNVRVQ